MIVALAKGCGALQECDATIDRDRFLPELGFRQRRVSRTAKGLARRQQK
jgi:hypothetical protein